MLTLIDAFTSAARGTSMSIQKRVFSWAILAGALLHPAGVLVAQDVAAAARANRANRVAAAAAKNDSAWYSPTRVSLTADAEGAGAGTMVYEIGSNQDLKISTDFEENGKRQTSDVMLINGLGQWMLVKNVPLEKGYEIDVLDVPVLNLKLVLELLRAAAPEGPAQIKERATFHVQEERRSIAVNTASASGGLEAPWSLQATIEPTAPDACSFELTAKHTETMHLRGIWQRTSKAPHFEDDMALEGWHILKIGPIKTTDESGTILDYGAQISKKHPKTLGELRRTPTD
jgi:hypothetical protein